MNKFHEALHKLVEKDEFGANFDEQLENNIQAACGILNINPESENISDLQNWHDKNIRWKFISLSFHILLAIKNDESVLSLTYINDVKKLFQFIISLGILPNLIPGVGISLNKRVKNIDKIPTETISIPQKYSILSGTVKGLLFCLKLNSLRNFIITNHFNDLLGSLLQLCNAPIKKPEETETVTTENEFIMSKDFYDEIMTDRQNFQKELNTLLDQSYSPQVIKELMFFYGNTASPKWLKSVVYKILIQKLQQSDGTESLIKAVLDFEILDTGARWKQYDIIVKLLMTKPVNVDDNYYENICSQVLKLLNKKDKKGEININFVQIVSACIKYLYEKDKTNCEKYFLNSIISKLTQYSSKNNNEIEYGMKTNEFTQIILLWFCSFVETSPTLQTLPYHLLTPIVAILFNIFLIGNDVISSKIIENLKSILIKYISDCEESEKKDVYESFLFGKETNIMCQLKDNIAIIIDINSDIVMKKSEATIHYSSLKRSDAFLDLINDTDTKNVIVSLCIYLLDISINITPIIKPTDSDLLHLENENPMLMDEMTERKLVSYNLLSNLIENPNVHKHLQEHPENILNFIESTLKTFIENDLHKSVDCDDEQYQNMFKLIMILNIICEKTIITDSLINTLILITNETSNIEMKLLISSICYSTIPPDKEKIKKPSEYEKALEDICDPHLPVRGHGLMTLAKLIEEKDPETCSNKQYILNVSQQFLKNEDSYIYLNAIKILAALGNSFPDTIINILTDEYSTESKELLQHNCETRMKIGEVLLRVVKSLGEAAPKYKSILLNSFLLGVRDEDHLMRASSLSNLGEVCRVLGFKLGSVVSEVLSCIHAVIATDKAVEARRAAVSVIRYLFVGLQEETIVFLKDDILPIYRTLKLVYTNDPDDITRLQAQLALEELNANIQSFLFPTIKSETQIAMLNN